MTNKILFINTGGTISSSAGKCGLAPAFSADHLLDEAPELRMISNIDSLNLMNLDSTNLQPSHWATVAQTVNSALDEYDGIVIAHGTDTMAYTASALSFMLGTISKPVILTGSQFPIGKIDGDSKANLKNAFITACCGWLSGVHIVFNGRVILGCRASKVRTISNNSFDSINYPYIGVIEDGKFTGYTTRGVVPTHQHAFNNKYRNEVFLLRLFPGTNPELLTIVQSMGYKGVVIEGFGLGGVPSHERSFLPKIKELRNDGISVAVTTQCLYEGSNLTIYEVGQNALEAGAIPCYDMTTEAIVTKMMWALGQTVDPSEVRHIMATNYVNEITLPDEKGRMGSVSQPRYSPIGG